MTAANASPQLMASCSRSTVSAAGDPVLLCSGSSSSATYDRVSVVGHAAKGTCAMHASWHPLDRAAVLQSQAPHTLTVRGTRFRPYNRNKLQKLASTSCVQTYPARVAAQRHCSLGDVTCHAQPLLCPHPHLHSCHHAVGCGKQLCI
jgi:hypothetical protein